MAEYPFIHNYSTGRSYYGSSLESNKNTNTQVWTNRQAPGFYEGQGASLFKTAAIGAGVFGAGFIPTRKGRVWDYYVKGLRGIEEFSPGGMLRTFQFSTIASQFESVNTKGFHVSKHDLRTNKVYHNYLTKLIGQKQGQPNTFNKLIAEGVTLRDGKLYWGTGDEVALKYASAIRVPEGTSAHFGSGYARSIGTKVLKDKKLHDFFGKVQPFGLASDVFNPVTSNMPTQIIGGRNVFQYSGRQLAGLGTEYVSRFNRLLEAPLEMEPFRTVFETVQKGMKKFTKRKLHFAIQEAGGVKMFGRLAAKYGGAATAVYMGYQTVDYMFRNSSLLDNTLFEEGLTYGLATVGTEANLMLSKAAEATGLHSYREAQEEIAPGSTSFGTLAAFPLTGALGASFASYGALVASMIKHPGDAATARREIVDKMRSFQGEGPWNRLARMFVDPDQLYSREDTIGKLLRKIATPKQFSVRSEPGKKVTELSYKLLGRLGPTKVAAAIGAGAGLALTLPFLPGALIPSTRPDELEAIYSGKQEVAIRKGRWWEFGRSPYEGGRIMYYRPHWYPRMKINARDKAIYGEKELSPLEKFWKKEFTYELEQEHYYDRPYPVTALPFEDIPLVGPLLAHTVGKLIKPSAYMHEEEWRRGDSVLSMPARWGANPATDIGELPPGVPTNPNEIEGLIGEQAYRMTEMMGLPGFMMTSIKEALTGSPDLFDQSAQLESSRRLFGAERAYWDLEIGGGLGSTEALRRLFPHKRNQIPLYNPIRNTMPDWLPGPGEKSEDFLHGDPYSKIQEGELRLPGKGYAARFEELEGVSAEDYPLIHQYRILADVAPYTDKYKNIRKQVVALRKTKAWNEYQEQIYQTTEEQTKQKKIRTTFEEYKYLTPMGGLFGNRKTYGAAESGSLLARMNEITADKNAEQEPGIFTKIFGGYWEALAHNAETAIDQMTPAAPAAKLVHIRSPIEAYERTQLYGSSNAFWNHPIRDFVRPATQLAMSSFGYKDVPDHIRNRRNLEEYFDILNYVKNARLSNLARSAGDTEAVKEFEQNKDQTLFGINPFTRNYSSLFRALPRRDRDYFNSFSEATTPEERSRILEMVPDNEKPLYVARWKLAYADELRKAKKKNLLTDKQEKEADEIISQTFEEARTEGFPSNKELFAEFVATRADGENYGDWYRRTKLLSTINLPGPDWVGWHPSVDLQDVKLKVVESMGENMHDYDLWQQRAQSLQNKPYLTDNVVEPIINQERLTSDEIRGRINKLLLSTGARPQITMNTTYGTNSQSRINLNIEQDTDLDSLIGGMI